MSRTSPMIHLRDLSKVFFWAGIFLVGLAVSSAQAATVTSYRSGNTTTVNGGSAAWSTAAGGLGPIGLETFAVDVGNPPTFADYAFGRINFGNSPGNFAASGPALLGSVTGGALVDRADNSSFGPAIHPFIEFSGLGVMAFGANFDLGPNTPGTGLSFLVTFVDGSTQNLSPAAIGNPSSAVGFVGFFGIVANTVAIRSILFNEGGQFTCPGTNCKDFETFSMTNVQYVSAVPIPAALPLFLSAIAALGFFGRRKLKAAV